MSKSLQLVALLFRLEQRPPPKELGRLVDEVIGWFSGHEGLERLQGLFAELVYKIFAGLGLKVSRLDDLHMMKSNLFKLGQTWKRQWRAEAMAEGMAEGRAKGIAKGRAEGLAKGKVEGKAEALIYLLVERFGTLGPSLRKRISRANLKTLESWFKRAIVAPDLRSVFSPPR